MMSTCPPSVANSSGVRPSLICSGRISTEEGAYSARELSVSSHLVDAVYICSTAPQSSCTTIRSCGFDDDKHPIAKNIIMNYDIETLQTHT